MWDWLDEAWDVVSDVGGDVLDWFSDSGSDVVDAVSNVDTSGLLSGAGNLLEGAGDFLDIYNPETGNWDWQGILNKGKSIYDYFDSAEEAQKQLDLLNQASGPYNRVMREMELALSDSPEKRRNIRKEKERVTGIYKDYWDEADAQSAGMWNLRGLGPSATVRQIPTQRIANERANILAGIDPAVRSKYVSNVMDQYAPYLGTADRPGFLTAYMQNPMFSDRYQKLQSAANPNIVGDIIKYL